MKQQEIKQSLRRRYEFIEFQLMWEGEVGRKKLQQKFEISPQQATNDLTSYLDIAPSNMAYDPRKRTYVTGASFRPKFIKGEASEYLLHLEMLHHGYRNECEIWPSNVPSFDAVSIASRKADPTTLKAILNAIRSCKCVEVSYVSLSSESEGRRRLYPHAIASDGHRWHMRAFDREKQRHSDFVLSRIEKIEVVEDDFFEVPNDLSWSSFVQLRLAPDPKLSARQKERLQIEYGMVNGELTLSVRRAMLFYYLRFYGFDPLELEDNCMRNKSSFHLRLKNLDEVERCLNRRG